MGQFQNDQLQAIGREFYVRIKYKKKYYLKIQVTQRRPGHVTPLFKNVKLIRHVQTTNVRQVAYVDNGARRTRLQSLLRPSGPVGDDELHWVMPGWTSASVLPGIWYSVLNFT